MASVQLSTVLLSSVDNLGSPLELDVSGLSERTPRPGEVRNYGGRLRVVTDDDRGATVLQVQARQTSRATWRILREWADGRTLLWRDHTGRKLYGFTLDVPATELIVDDVDVEIAFTFTEVTVDEAV